MYRSPVLEEVFAEDVLCGVLVLQHLGEKCGHLFGFGAESHVLTWGGAWLDNVSLTRRRAAARRTHRVRCVHSHPTVVVKLDVAGQRFVRRRKHGPFVFQELPLDAVCVSLFFPPGKSTTRAA